MLSTIEGVGAVRGATTGITVMVGALTAGLASAGPERGATRLFPTMGLMRLPPVIGLTMVAGSEDAWAAACTSEIASAFNVSCTAAGVVVAVDPGTGAVAAGVVAPVAVSAGAWAVAVPAAGAAVVAAAVAAVVCAAAPADVAAVVAGAVAPAAVSAGV